MSSANPTRINEFNFNVYVSAYLRKHTYHLSFPVIQRTFVASN